MMKILVGLDGSERAPVVLAEAATLAQRLNAELVLFRAVTFPDHVPQTALSIAPDEVAKVLEEAAHGSMQELAGQLPPTVKRRIAVGLGSPWRAVCDAARTEAADLIIIGSHGYGGLD